MEFLIRDRLSWLRFLGFDLGAPTPDRNTIWTFRERLVRAGAMDDLFAAFDAHLIGVDPDYRLHVSDRLLDQNDGPMLEVLKQLDGEALHLPNLVKDRPDRDRHGIRFERFKVVA